MHRILQTLSMLVASALAALAQDVGGPEYFPYVVGDRWVYDVEGTTANGDTIRAVVDWTVLEIDTTPDADTVWVRSVRRDLDGEISEATCKFERSRGTYQFLRGYSSSPLCRSSGGFPFGNGLTTSYPFLNNLVATGSAEVSVGTGVYVTETATASFRNSYTSGPNQPYVHSDTHVRTHLAEGIGFTRIEVIETEYRGGLIGYTHRDTVRATLIGADVGGDTFGDIQPVASEPVTEAETVSISIGPNPVRGRARAWLSGEPGRRIHLSVFDVQGREVLNLEGQAGETVTLDFGGVSPGLYIVRARSSGASASTRVLDVR